MKMTKELSFADDGPSIVLQLLISQFLFLAFLLFFLLLLLNLFLFIFILFIFVIFSFLFRISLLFDHSLSLEHFDIAVYKGPEVLYSFFAAFLQLVYNLAGIVGHVVSAGWVGIASYQLLIDSH